MELLDELPVAMPSHNPLNDQRKDALRTHEFALFGGGDGPATANAAGKGLDFDSGTRVESLDVIPE